MKQAVAYANANIALIKYWGKNASNLNIPIVSSLSMTLNNLGSTVSVSEALSKHEGFIDQKPIAESVFYRLSTYLEEVRKIYSFNGFLKIASHSSVPFEAGLASSASFFAALATALDEFLALKLNQRDLSKLARMGSGSAARSIYQGYVGLYGGRSLVSDEAYAFPVETPLAMSMVISIVSDEKKSVSSREAMRRCQKTSPFFDTFVDHQEKDFEQALLALKEGRFAELGELMEHSTLKMFSTMWTANPALFYWKPESLRLIEFVQGLRKNYGPKVFFTMDAGPNVKMLCEESFLPTLIEHLKKDAKVEKFLVTKPGRGAHCLYRDDNT